VPSIMPGSSSLLAANDLIEINSHYDCIEIDHINGDRRNARASNLQALHGHCHDAKTREQRESLPRGKRDKPQDTEERREAKVSRAVLEQR